LCAQKPVVVVLPLILFMLVLLGGLTATIQMGSKDRKDKLDVVCEAWFPVRLGNSCYGGSGLGLACKGISQPKVTLRSLLISTNLVMSSPLLYTKHSLPCPHKSSSAPALQLKTISLVGIVRR
jgi:hypothetical protein